MARFTIGQEVIAISFKRNNGETFQLFEMPYCYNHEEEEVEVLIKKLTVTEQHAVLEEWSNECSAYGFVLKDTAGDEWYNQYPIAAYGQLDCSRDYVFTIKEAKIPGGQEEEEKAILQKTGGNFQYMEICTVLDLLQRGVKILKTTTGLDVVIKKLEALFNNIVERLNKEFGLVIIETPIFEGAKTTGIKLVKE